MAAPLRQAASCAVEAPFPLLALPEQLLTSIVNAVKDLEDRKSLRATCRALRRTVDALLSGATLQLRHIASLPPRALITVSGTGELLRRLQRLVIHDSGQAINGEQLAAAVQSFGRDGLSHLSALTSLKLTVQPLEDYRRIPMGIYSRGSAMLRLLAHLPPGLSELSFRGVTPGAYPESTAAENLRCVARLTALTALALPYALKPSDAFLRSVGGTLPWRQLLSLELSVSWKNVRTVGKLTGLTRLVLHRADLIISLDVGASGNERSSAALAPLTDLRELDLRDIPGADVSDRDGSLARAIGGMPLLSRLQFSFASVQPRSVPPPVVVAASSFCSPLVQLGLRFVGREIAEEDVSRLAALPQLATLTAFQLRLRAGTTPLFASLTRLELGNNFPVACPGPEALLVQPDSFPSLRVLELVADELDVNRHLNLLLYRLRQLKCLEDLAVYRAGSLGRATIEQFVLQLPRLKRFTVSYCFKKSEADVLAGWMMSFERRLRPRVVHCALLPAGSVSQP